MVPFSIYVNEIHTVEPEPPQEIEKYLVNIDKINKDFLHWDIISTLVYTGLIEFSSDQYKT